MRTLKITWIATAIATGVGFWAGPLGLMQKLWPEHAQLGSFLLCLVACLAVQKVDGYTWSCVAAETRVFSKLPGFTTTSPVISAFRRAWLNRSASRAGDEVRKDDVHD